MADPTPQRSRATLRIAEGALPAADLDEPTRRIVVSAAEAIAERIGVGIASIECDDRSITIEVEGPTLVALGLVAELRRSTEAWHRAKFGTTLWGETP